MKTFHVYILASRTRTLYVGVTSNLVRCVLEHRRKLIPSFTARYNITRLVYFEGSTDALAAIAREKQLKSWSRRKKIQLVEAMNPRWEDLAEPWFENRRAGDPSLRSG